jgi:hypothetical protein
MTFWATSGCACPQPSTSTADRDWFTAVVPRGVRPSRASSPLPIAYLSPIYRSNGVIFLEASFYSLFLALGLLVTLYLGRSVSPPRCWPAR